MWHGVCAMIRKSLIILLTFVSLATVAIGVNRFAITIPINRSLSIEIWCSERSLLPFLAIIQTVKMPERLWRRWKSLDFDFVGGYFTSGAGEPSGDLRSLGGKTVVRYRGVVFRSWFLVIVLAALTALTFIRVPFRRWHRRRHGLCIRCGYNLEGNVSGVCPECGEAR